MKRRIRTCGRVHRVLALIADQKYAWIYEKKVRVPFSAKNIELALKWGLVERFVRLKGYLAGEQIVRIARPTNVASDESGQYRLRLTEHGWRALEALDAVQPYRQGRVYRESREYAKEQMASGRDYAYWTSGEESAIAGFKFVEVEINPDPIWVEHFKHRTW